jgi:O-antigen/teichoic acid export membrane protein
MNRKFIINLIFAVGINLLVKPFWVLGVERGVQNAIGAEQYGFYFSLFSFSFLFNVILDFGINNYNTGFIARYPKLLTKKFSQLVILKLMLLLAYVIITFIVAFFVGYNSVQLKVLLVLCLNQALSFSITYIRTNISGLQFFITDSLLSTLDRMLMILFCSLLLWGHVLGPMKLEWFIYSQTLSYSITLIVCYLVLKPHLAKIHWKFNKAFTIHLIKKSYPYAILGILMGFYSKMDGVLIERLLPEGAMQAGHYASAYRLLDAANMIAVLFAALLLPMFARIIQSKESPGSLLQLAFASIILPALIGASICWFYNKEIIFLLNKTNNPEIEKVLALLMLSFIFTCTVYIYGTFLTAIGDLRLLNYIAFFACIVNFILNIVLIRRYGIMGAAISALVTQAFVACSHFMISYGKFRIDFHTSFFLRILIFAALQIAFPILLGYLECHFLVKILLQLTFAFITILILKIVSLDQMKKLIYRT